MYAYIKYIIFCLILWLAPLFHAHLNLVLSIPSLCVQSHFLDIPPIRYYISFDLKVWHFV